MSSTVNLRSILDANKLTDANFMDWLRNLRIFLKADRVAYVLDGPLPESPAIDASEWLSRIAYVIGWLSRISLST